MLNGKATKNHERHSNIYCYLFQCQNLIDIFDCAMISPAGLGKWYLTHNTLVRGINGLSCEFLARGSIHHCMAIWLS